MTLRHPRRSSPTGRDGRRRRRCGIVAAAALGLALAGCTAPLPEVTYYANGTTVRTDPSLWCTIDPTELVANCDAQDLAEAPRLSVRPGQPVHIDVPGAVAEQPWTIYFRYRTAAGELRDGRSEVFDDGRLAYTLRPIADDDQLVLVEVRAGLVPMAGEDGIDIGATQNWLLLIEPEAE